MLDTEEYVEINLGGLNVPYYESLGYEIPREKNVSYHLRYIKNTKIKVKIKDLLPSSQAKVNPKCDYCGKENEVIYKDYLKSINIDDNVKTYCCHKCLHEKFLDIAIYKQNNNMLKIGDDYYFYFKENIHKEFYNYFNKHGCLDDFGKDTDTKKMYDLILKYHHKKLWEVGIELGYSIYDLYNTKIPRGYFTKENIIKSIQWFINKNNRFPTLEECRDILKIGVGVIYSRFESLDDIKRIMDYNDESNLKDDNNYYNGSSYEYKLAQWLIHNTNISYERNVKISPNIKEDGKYDCDFVLRPKEYPEGIWVEIWGGLKNPSDASRFKDYERSYKTKLALYEKYNKTLISLYPEDFDKKSLDELQEYLHGIFNKYIDLTYDKIDNTLISPKQKYTDDEVFEMIMMASNDKDWLPTVRQLNSYYGISTVSTLMKKHGGCFYFAKKYNKQTKKYNKLLNLKEEFIYE